MVVVLNRDEEVLLATSVAIAASMCGTSSLLLNRLFSFRPLAARAQQANRVRRIGVLMNVDDADQRVSYAAFLQVLQELGWTDGHNVRIDTRWAGGSASEIRKQAAELVALAPDVIVASGTAGLGPLLENSRTVPIVFANVADPVGAGFVESMSRPGGNVTGFVQFEYTLSGKWLVREGIPGRDEPDFTSLLCTGKKGKGQNTDEIPGRWPWKRN